MISLRAASIPLLAVGLLLSGCSSATEAQSTGPVVSLSSFGPIDSNVEDLEPIFVLGAGDELGEAIFVQYVAYIRSLDEQEPVYATVTLDDLNSF
jgi:hypothetical protein